MKPYPNNRFYETNAPTYVAALAFFGLIGGVVALALLTGCVPH